MAYAQFSDFENYLEGFGTSYYGTRDNLTGSISINTTKFQSDMDNSFNRINSILMSIDRIPLVPVGTNPRSGSYHPYLVEWNVVDTIFSKLKARHLIELNGILPEWMNDFGSRCNAIISGLVSGKITLDTDTSNTGIGMAVRVAGSGIATMYTNWDSGFYNGSDYNRIFRIKVTDFSNGSRVGQSKFVVSGDNGYSYDTALFDTGTSWVNIANGLQVRFAPGLGTSDQFVYGDTWSVEVKPQNHNIVNRGPKFKRFSVG